jgi:7,8-dihydropterin-6-yl-methyl-4-(beta-D-ribofuranosyl)aminobenzene 5'-phosphate synthase
MVERDGSSEKPMRLICVVDDAVQPGSPFWGEHGLAFLIETEGGRVLFDTGQSGTVLLHNLGLLDVDPATIDAVAISHAHYDHTGGLLALLGHLRPGTPLCANPDLFRERCSRRKGKLQSVGLSMTRAELAGQMMLELSATPLEIVSGVWTTGEIAERPEPQGSSDHHRMREGGALVADAYRDDMALMLQTGDQVVLLCGCCHAGLLNTLAHVKRTFERPIAVIAGGLHLTSATADDLRHIGEVLLAMPALQRVYPSHCTGKAAIVTLTRSLGSAVVHPCPAGTVLEF